MKGCACPPPPPAPRASLVSTVSSVSLREQCISILSTVIAKLTCAILTLLSAEVGATLGVLIGAFAGLKTEKGFLHGAITGAANGVILSKKILEILLATWDSDDAVIASFFSLVSVMASIAGTTLGAYAGAVVGLKSKSSFLHGAAVGAIMGCLLSIEIFRKSLLLWDSDDWAIDSFIHFQWIIDAENSKQETCKQKLCGYLVEWTFLPNLPTGLPTGGNGLQLAGVPPHISSTLYWSVVYWTQFLPIVQENTIFGGECGLCLLRTKIVHSIFPHAQINVGLFIYTWSKFIFTAQGRRRQQHHSRGYQKCLADEKDPDL
ncbi:hypothetical protein D5086_011662 [Populus alba]|uniref:Uncharacterized protein n=1 Tax=Populus alba TaxID=43335 RepID=A0ACC4CFE1_POPAL